MSNDNFAMRLRGNGNTYEDLVSGNTWQVGGLSGHGLSTVDGKFGGKALYFNGATYLKLNSSQKTAYVNSWFTLSFWCKYTKNARELPLMFSGFLTSSVGLYFFAWHPASPNNPLVCFGALGSTIPDISSKSQIADNEWHHIAIVYNANKLFVYIDGECEGISNSSPNFNLMQNKFVIGTNYGSSGNLDGNSNTYFVGAIDDFCVLPCALWDGDFTPPDDYLDMMSTIYLTGQEAWGIDSTGTFSQLSANFPALSASQKIALCESVVGIPSIDDINTLAMPIKAVRYSETSNTKPDCTVVATPNGQTITPKGRIPLLKYNKIRQVTITGGTTGNGVVKIAVTKDSSTYQVYDTVNSEWKTIDIADIGNDGMSLTDVSALTSAEWIAYDCMDTGIGFAYYLEIASTTDTAYTDELSLNVELVGEMKSIIKGTDFDYSYPSNYVLQVKLYKNGDFRINYNPGPPSTTLDIPTVSRALEYNGTEQSAPINNYDSSKMSMIGTTAATNAGVYTVVITPNVGYEWSDLSTDPKTLTWTIIKADSNLTLTPTALTLAVGASDTITAAFDGDGVLSAVPSDTNVSVSVSGNDIVVTGVAAGSDTVTASVTATDNYNADIATATITVS